MDKNGDALEILNGLISEMAEGQILINLQTRGGLTGINSDANILFVKAENFFCKIHKTLTVIPL